MINTRPATLHDAAAIAKVHIGGWRSTYQGIVPQSYLDRLSYEKRQAMWADILSKKDTDSVHMVATDEHDNIIGFISAGKARNQELGYDAELYALYVSSEHQGQGIGKQLMHRLAELLTQHNFHSMYLWVLEKNPSRQFYRKMGAQLFVQTKTADFDGYQLTEVAYGWNDLKSLLNR